VTRRFRATIRKQGPNPYVDVPAGVSRAFSPHAREGRIRVEGRLEKAAIRGTLVPVGGGRHRLFLNGGMRSAAGVDTGDTVTLELRATPYDVVRPPRDVAVGLREAGARAAFDIGSPSYRHEILRWIDDARTPEARRRRIAQSIDRLLGRTAAPSPRGAALASRPLWTCPECGNEFVHRNQYHSCRRYELDQPFVGKPGWVRDVFDRLRAMVEAFGPVKVLPYRDKVSFMVRVRFAGAVPRKRWLDVAFWLPQRIDSPRFHKVETITPDAHLHLVRVTRPEDLDAELAGWLREAYAVGRQEHLTGRGAGGRAGS
jgi:hypothetical protein